MLRLLPVLLCALLITACAAPEAPEAPDAPEPVAEAAPEAPAEPEAPAGLFLGLSGDGIQVIDGNTGSARMIAFETGREQVQTVVTNLLGEPSTSGVNEECGAGPLGYTNWPNGFTLHFAEHSFVGWAYGANADDANLTNMAGIGIGSTLADIEEVMTVNIEDTTIGPLADVGGMYSVLTGTDATAEITDMWAGVGCVFF